MSKVRLPKVLVDAARHFLEVRKIYQELCQAKVRPPLKTCGWPRGEKLR